MRIPESILDAAPALDSLLSRALYPALRITADGADIWSDHGYVYQQQCDSTPALEMFK